MTLLDNAFIFTFIPCPVEEFDCFLEQANCNDLALDLQHTKYFVVVQIGLNKLHSYIISVHKI